jgi:hypothetical protein
MTRVPFVLGGASLPLAPTPYFPFCFQYLRFYSAVCRAAGGHELPLLGYPAHSVVTMSTELFAEQLEGTNRHYLVIQPIA